MAIGVLHMIAGSRAIVDREQVDHYFQGIESKLLAAKLNCEEEVWWGLLYIYVHGCARRDVKKSRSKNMISP